MLRCRPLLALSLLCSAAQAQTTFYEHGSTFPWTSGASLSPFKHPVSGRFVDPSQIDVCALANGVPTFCASPETFGLFSSIPTTSGEVVNDISTVIGAGTAGTDGLATVGSEGLRLRTYSSTIHDFTWTLLSNHTNWMGAKLVRVGDLDGSGSVDYAGAGSTGTFIVCRFNGGASAPRFTVPNTILDIQLVQWDTDTPKELAVLTTWGLYVYESNGTLDASYARPGASGGQIAIVHVAGQTNEVVEWLSPSSTPGANPTLYEVALGNGSPTLVTALARNFVKMVAEDMPLDGTMTRDGNTDLLLYGTANCAPTFFRQGSTPRFSAGIDVDPPSTSCEDWWLQLSTVVDLTGAQDPYFGDLNGDGLPDILIAIGLTPTPPPPLSVPTRRVEYLRCRNNVPPPNGNAVPSTPWLNFGLKYLNPTQKDLFIQVITDPNNLPAGTIGANATHVEFSVWNDTWSGSSNTIQGQAVCRWCVPIGKSAGETQTGKITIDQGNACYTTGVTLYWIQARYVNWNGVETSSPTAAGSAFISYMGTDKTILETCLSAGQSIPDIVLVENPVLSSSGGDLCFTDSGPLGWCNGHSNAFARGPGHATRPSIRRDSNGTIPTLNPTPRYADPLQFPGGLN